jgi:hypothetical protein
MVIQEFGSPRDIRFLAGAEPKFDCLTEGVTGNVQLGAESSARAAQRFIPLF